MELIWTASAAIVSGIIFFFAGIVFRKNVAEKAIGAAELQAGKIIDEARRTAEQKQKEAVLEAKEEVHKIRAELDREIKERRVEISRQENRIQQKEENLDKKVENLERKEENIAKKSKELEAMQEDVLEIQRKQLEHLERISGFSAEEAKDYLIKAVEGEVRHEMAVLIKELERQANEEAEAKARDIISMAIQRYAADQVAESTVSVVALPSDEMKGRIIGREGRNIRTIETLTGIDLIIDDTPEAVILSGFDPVRREIARLTLERLISDGRIHPARIEESFDKATKEVEAIIKTEGERMVFEAGIHSVHPEMIKLLGRLKYRTSYGQNVMLHSMEVAFISGIIAGELGADVNTAKRAGLLHDIGKAVDHEQDGSHIELGVSIARKYRENETVVHAIMAHHGDVESEGVIDFIVQAADAISAARPGARRENIETYIKRLEKLEGIANEFSGVDKSFAIQAGREIRIMVKPDEVSDDNVVLLARDIVKRIESELEYPGQIKVHVVREIRAIDFAK